MWKRTSSWLSELRTRRGWWLKAPLPRVRCLILDNTSFFLFLSCFETLFHCYNQISFILFLKETKFEKHDMIFFLCWVSFFYLCLKFCVQERLHQTAPTAKTFPVVSARNVGVTNVGGRRTLRSKLCVMNVTWPTTYTASVPPWRPSLTRMSGKNLLLSDVCRLVDVTKVSCETLFMYYSPGCEVD